MCAAMRRTSPRPAAVWPTPESRSPCSSIRTPEQIAASLRTGAAAVELHTGGYADASSPGERAREVARLAAAASLAAQEGLKVHAGHGLNYHNVGPVAALTPVVELNIGHAIVARAVLTGMAEAVREMKRLMVEARRG